MKIVIDTNVIVSGLINANGAPAQILNLLLNGRLTILYDNRILQEYEEVLSRKKFGFKHNEIDPIFDYIKNEGEYITAEPTSCKFKDLDDKIFYEVAKTAGARCIITGNTDHYPNEVFIKTPRTFIDFYLKENETSKTETT